MSDIVERLRTRDLVGVHDLAACLCEEAAKEIESLHKILYGQSEQIERLRKYCEDREFIAYERAQEIERLRTEIEEWRQCACYDPMMSGIPAFKGWDRSQMDRCRKRFIEAR